MWLRLLLSCTTAGRYPAGTTFSVKGYNEWWDIDYGEWPEDPLETVIAADENLKDIDDMDCSSTDEWWAYCTREESGGIGFAWAWEEDPGGTMGTLYLRVVMFSCYNRNQMGRCACVRAGAAAAAAVRRAVLRVCLLGLRGGARQGCGGGCSC